MASNFLFHRVNPEREQLWDAMPPELFEKCIAYINSKFKVVLLEDLLTDPDKHARQSIATICFGDGYLDNYTYALPILEKYGCKASFYIVTDGIDFKQLTWTHQLGIDSQTRIANWLISNSISFQPNSMRPRHLRERVVLLIANDSNLRLKSCRICSE